MTVSTFNFEDCAEASRQEGEFSDFQEIPSAGYNRIIKAQRRGKWYILKAVKREYSQLKVYETALQKEYDILSSLQHPNIVSARGFEYVDGLGDSIVMEYVCGKNLSDRLKEGMTPELRMQVVRELMDAVAYIHKKQIVHRDLKPSNIMLTDDGDHVKLIDFGLSDSEYYVILKQPSGTEAFMSPEQKAEPKSDSRNDIYSLGCILESMVPAGKFAHVIARCKAPIDQRYPTVSALRADIDKVGRPSWKWAVALGMVLLCILFLGVRYHWVDEVYSVARLVNITHYSFSQDGLYYNILSEEEQTVELTNNGTFGSYKGDITVPSQVQWGGRTYTVVRVGDDTFRQCPELIAVVLPQTIRSLGSSVFYDTDYLATINLPDNITEMGDSVFSSCGYLRSVRLPKRLRSVPPYCFVGDWNLRSIHLPEGIESIQRDAFAGSFIECITFPRSLRAIERGVFWECPSLKEVRIPAGVERFGDFVFWHCDSLRDVYVERSEPLGITNIFQSLKDVRLHVPQGSAEAYRQAEGWKELTVTEEMR